MDNPLFYGAKLKVKRADQHIQELIRSVNTFFQPDRNRVGVDKEAEAPGESLVVKVSGKDFEDLPLIVGDAIHNLRTALDHVAYELVGLCGGRLTYHTKFTIGETRKEAIGSIEGQIEGIGLDMITHILEYIQPYRGGNDVLWSLNHLDIVDKHRLIVRVRPIIGVAFQVTLGDDGGTFLTFGIPGEEETRLVGIPPEAQVEGHGNPMLHVLFDDVAGLKGQSVIPTLRHIRDAVIEAVQEVERAFLVTRK